MLTYTINMAALQQRYAALALIRQHLICEYLRVAPGTIRVGGVDAQRGLETR